MRILFVGEIEEGRTSVQRMNALKELGHEVTPINYLPPMRADGKRHGILSRVLGKCGFPSDVCKMNRAIQEKSVERVFHVLWLEKTLSLRPQTLFRFRAQQPQCRCVFYTVDDMANPHNQSRYYRKLVPGVDLYCTTKSFQLSELKLEGWRRVILVGNGYDSNTHRPYQASMHEEEEFGADVGFIGGFELDRYRQMLSLAQNGVALRIRGSFWESVVDAHPLLEISCGDLLGEDYRKAICATSINLCFLRKVNRDLQTTRSVEIPACGAFMLAERTKEHLEMFEEGREAEFFSSREELLEKVRYYLTHSDKRERIAVAGRQRCLTSGYSNTERLAAVLTELKSLG